MTPSQKQFEVSLGSDNEHQKMSQSLSMAIGKKSSEAEKVENELHLAAAQMID